MVNYSCIIGRAARLMYSPSVIDSPSGRLPEKDPRWDLSGTETCGGGKSISWTPLRVSDFSGIYSAGIRSNGAWWAPRGTRARPGGSWAPPGSSGLFPKLLVFILDKSPKSFVAFGLHLVLIFCKTKTGQKTATGTGH